MWKWIENNAILFISFMGALASAAGTLIHIYWKIKMNSFSIEQMWKKHHKDVEEIKICQEKDKETLYKEIEDLKGAMQYTNENIVGQLESISKEVGSMGKDLSYMKGGMDVILKKIEKGE